MVSRLLSSYANIVVASSALSEETYRCNDAQGSKALRVPSGYLVRSCHCLPLLRMIKPNSKLRQEMRVLPKELALRSIHVLSRKAVMPRHDRFRVLARSFTCFPGFTAKLHTSSLLSRASERSYIPQNPRHPRSKFHKHPLSRYYHHQSLPS